MSDQEILSIVKSWWIIPIFILWSVLVAIASRYIGSILASILDAFVFLVDLIGMIIFDIRHRRARNRLSRSVLNQLDSIRRREYERRERYTSVTGTMGSDGVHHRRETGGGRYSVISGTGGTGGNGFLNEDPLDRIRQQSSGRLLTFEETIYSETNNGSRNKRRTKPKVEIYDEITEDVVIENPSTLKEKLLNTRTKNTKTIG